MFSLNPAVFAPLLSPYPTEVHPDPRKNPKIKIKLKIKYNQKGRQEIENALRKNSMSAGERAKKMYEIHCNIVMEVKFLVMSCWKSMTQK